MKQGWKTNQDVSHVQQATTVMEQGTWFPPRSVKRGFGAEGALQKRCHSINHMEQSAQMAVIVPKVPQLQFCVPKEHTSLGGAKHVLKIVWAAIQGSSVVKLGCSVWVAIVTQDISVKEMLVRVIQKMV